MLVDNSAPLQDPRARCRLQPVDADLVALVQHLEVLVEYPRQLAIVATGAHGGDQLANPGDVQFRLLLLLDPVRGRQFPVLQPVRILLEAEDAADQLPLVVDVAAQFLGILDQRDDRGRLRRRPDLCPVGIGLLQLVVAAGNADIDRLATDQPVFLVLDRHRFDVVRQLLADEAVIRQRVADRADAELQLLEREAPPRPPLPRRVPRNPARRHRRDQDRRRRRSEDR